MHDQGKRKLKTLPHWEIPVKNYLLNGLPRTSAIEASASILRPSF